MVSKPLSRARTFVCIVERSWTAAADADFGIRRCGPMCLNAAAARSYLCGPQSDRFDPADARKLRWRRPSSPQPTRRTAGDGGWGNVLHDVEAGYAATALRTGLRILCFSIRRPTPQPGSESAGLSRYGYDDPRLHVTSFVVAVERWSDGTDAR